jgi:hypothetical protein
MEKQVTLSYAEHNQLLDKIKELKKYIQDSEVNGKIKVRKILLYRETYYLDWGRQREHIVHENPLMEYDKIKAEENGVIKRVTKQLIEAHTEKVELQEKLEEANSKLEEANGKIPWYRKKLEEANGKIPWYRKK